MSNKSEKNPEMTSSKKIPLLEPSTPISKETSKGPRLVLKKFSDKIKNIMKKKSKKKAATENEKFKSIEGQSIEASETMMKIEDVVDNDNKQEKITLYEEFRLVERPESEINSAWKGAHLILFFLTFVFGSFCTFCFHVIMYMFDKKCVLYPEMVAVKDVKRSHPTGIILDYIAAQNYGSIPVEFVTTIWVEKGECYLPTYMPVLSGICGLIWTTMFLMSSSGTQTLSGLQRPWRIVPSVFIFSTIMSILCIYTTVITHKGLMDLCYKLANVFGTETTLKSNKKLAWVFTFMFLVGFQNFLFKQIDRCTYTINVATLTYDRRIRGVYQATQLTIAAAWLHTLCWLCAAILALARMLLVVDFRLVRVRADLIGNIELMLERHEQLIRTNEYVTDTDTAVIINDTAVIINDTAVIINDTAVAKQKSPESIKVHFENKNFGTESYTKLQNADDKPTGKRVVVPLLNDTGNRRQGDKPRPILASVNRKKSPKSINESTDTLIPKENQRSKNSESEKTLTFKYGSDEAGTSKENKFGSSDKDSTRIKRPVQENETHKAMSMRDTVDDRHDNKNDVGDTPESSRNDASLKSSAETSKNINVNSDEYTTWIKRPSQENETHGAMSNRDSVDNRYDNKNDVGDTPESSRNDASLKSSAETSKNINVDSGEGTIWLKRSVQENETHKAMSIRDRVDDRHDNKNDVGDTPESSRNDASLKSSAETSKNINVDSGEGTIGLKRPVQENKTHKAMTIRVRVEDRHDNKNDVGDTPESSRNDASLKSSAETSKNINVDSGEGTVGLKGPVQENETHKAMTIRVRVDDRHDHINDVDDTPESSRKDASLKSASHDLIPISPENEDTANTEDIPKKKKRKEKQD